MSNSLIWLVSLATDHVTLDVCKNIQKSHHWSLNCLNHSVSPRYSLKTFHHILPLSLCARRVKKKMWARQGSPVVSQSVSQQWAYISRRRYLGSKVHNDSFLLPCCCSELNVHRYLIFFLPLPALLPAVLSQPASPSGRGKGSSNSGQVKGVCWSFYTQYTFVLWVKN